MPNNNELSNVLDQINGTPAPVVNGAIKAIQTDEQAMMLAELKRLKSENEALRAANAAKKAQVKLGLKVSEKGAVSVYGMGRFPVTLYAEQWTRLLAHAKDLMAFIEANRDSLTSKS